VFSGVDFGCVVNSKKQLKLSKLLNKLSKKLLAKGFSGVLNLNFMENGLVLTDINPRFMGSGQLTTAIQLNNDEIPIALIHILLFLKVDFELGKKAISKIASPKSGSLIVLHSLENGTKMVCGDCKQGALSLLNLKKGRFVVSGAIPQKGKIVEAGSPLLRIYTKEKVLDPKTGKLNKKYFVICKEVYEKLDFVDPK